MIKTLKKKSILILFLCLLTLTTFFIAFDIKNVGAYSSTDYDSFSYAITKEDYKYFGSFDSDSSNISNVSNYVNDMIIHLRSDLSKTYIKVEIKHGNPINYDFNQSNVDVGVGRLVLIFKVNGRIINSSTPNMGEFEYAQLCSYYGGNTSVSYDGGASSIEVRTADDEKPSKNAISNEIVLNTNLRKGDTFEIDARVLFELQWKPSAFKTSYMDVCNRGVVSGSVEIDNSYAETITYSGQTNIKDNIVYTNDNFNFNYSTEALKTSSINGSKIVIRPNVVATANSETFTGQKSFKQDGLYDIKLTDELNSVVFNQKVILDKTAPTLNFESLFTPFSDMYGGAVVVKYDTPTSSQAPISVSKYTRRELLEYSDRLEEGGVIEEDIAFSSGKEFTEEGIYYITVQDLAGNTSTKQFVIKKQNTDTNYNRIKNTAFFKADNWTLKEFPYLKTVSVPATLNTGAMAQYSGVWSNNKTYIFANEENARKFVAELILASEVVKNADGSFNYKTKLSATANAKYDTVELLMDVVNHYASMYIKAVAEIKKNDNVHIDSSTVIMDNSVYDNQKEKPHIGKDYTFKNTSKTLTISSGKSFTYNSCVNFSIFSISENSEKYYGFSSLPFNQLCNTASGELKILVIDSLGLLQDFNVVYDRIAPYLTVDYTAYNGATESGETNKTIYNENSISNTNFKSLIIKGLIDNNDNIITARVVKPDGTVVITRDLSKLTFGYGDGYYFNAGGEYTLEIYDRSLNVFAYRFYIAGATPYVSASTSGLGENKSLAVQLYNGSDYTSIMDFDILRYGVKLPKGEYKEYDANGNLLNILNIDKTILYYEFYLGGEYQIVFYDNFNRITYSEVITFKKGLPTYTINGVVEDGKTNKNVSITFGSTVGYELKHNGVIKLEYANTITSGGTLIEIPALAENNGLWSIKLFNVNDVNTSLSFAFTIDTMPALATAYDCETHEQINWTTCVSKPFYVLWSDTDVVKSKYSIDGSYQKNYEKYVELNTYGIYVFTLTDDVGNVSTYTIELDNIVEYTLSLDGKNFEDNNVIFVKNGFTITEKEKLNIDVKRGVEPLTVYSGLQIVNEGEYSITLTDSMSNVITLKIVIDRTAPTVEINQGSDEFSPIAVVIDVADINTYKLKRNGVATPLQLANSMTFTDWGEYELTLSDRLSNSMTYTFKISKVAPIVQIYSVNGNELTAGDTVNNSFYFVWNDNNATGKLSLNGGLAKTYEQNTLINDEGVYTLTITDEANNKITASISIVKVIVYSFINESGSPLKTTIFNGVEKTDEFFSLVNNGLNVQVKKDDVAFDYVAGQKIEIDGKYYFYIYDNIGNFEERTIVLDTTAPSVVVNQGADLTAEVGVSIDITDAVRVEIIHTGVAITEKNVLAEQSYSFTDWGTYSIKVFDDLGNFSTANFEIKKRPPKIALKTVSGRIIENNDIVNESVYVEYEEELVIKYNIDGGVNYVYSASKRLSEQGGYTITITDLAGQVFKYSFYLDSSLAFGVIIDGQTVKDFSQKSIGKRYLELSINENMTVVYSINNGKDITLSESLVRFTEEGEYVFSLVDVAGNMQTLIFELDNTAPNISIDTDSITKSDVVLTVADINDIEKYTIKKDGYRLSKYILEKINIFTEEGNYSITVGDELENRKTIEFTIKRTINYKLSVPNGFITNGKVELELKENLTASAKYNGENMQLQKVDKFVFTDAGKYEITLTDDVGNVQVLVFTLDATKYRKTFSFDIPLDCEITVKKDGQEIDLDPFINQDTLTLNQDGEYYITYKKDGKVSTYSFVIDNVIPALVLNGEVVPVGTDLGKIKYDFTVGSTKKNSTIKLYFNDDEISFSSTDTFSSKGHYKIVITDEVGNEVVYEFDRAFTFNTGAIILFVMLGILIILVAILIIRRRIKMRIV